MNRTLINFLDTINQLLALCILVGSVAAAYFYGQSAQMGHYGFVTPSIFLYPIGGLIAGLVIASVVCGLLAILIEIERHLRALTVRQPATTGQPL